MYGVELFAGFTQPRYRVDLGNNNTLSDDDAAIIAQFWTEDARVPVHAVSQSVYSVIFCEPIERLIIDRFGPKEVRPCTKKRFEELQEKGLHNHIWD